MTWPGWTDMEWPIHHTVENRKKKKAVNRNEDYLTMTFFEFSKTFRLCKTSVSHLLDFKNTYAQCLMVIMILMLVEAISLGFWIQDWTGGWELAMNLPIRLLFTKFSIFGLIGELGNPLDDWLDSFIPTNLRTDYLISKLTRQLKIWRIRLIGRYLIVWTNYKG